MNNGGSRIKILGNMVQELGEEEQSLKGLTSRRNPLKLSDSYSLSC